MSSAALGVSSIPMGMTFIWHIICIICLYSYCCILIQENKTWHKVLRTLY